SHLSEDRRAKLDAQRAGHGGGMQAQPIPNPISSLANLAQNPVPIATVAAKSIEDVGDDAAGVEVEPDPRQRVICERCALIRRSESDDAVERMEPAPLTSSQPSIAMADGHGRCRQPSELGLQTVTLRLERASPDEIRSIGRDRESRLQTVGGTLPCVDPRQ